MQLTGAWLSEAIEMDFGVLAPITGRIGRYPSGRHGTPTWMGIIGDTNFPTEMTPWQEFCEHPPAGWQIFKQPSGLAWNAENLNWLFQTETTKSLPIDHPDRIARGRLYYQQMVDTWGEDSDWVKRYVKAEYGNDPSGAAVFQNTFRPNFHLVDDTNVQPGFPLLVGQDFGRDPWSLICQPDHLGRVIVHEEVPAENVGLEKHCVQSLRPVLLQSRYFGCRVAIVGDPAGVAKDSHSEETSFELLTRCGFPSFPAPTNDIDPRLRSVESFFGRQVNGGPALIINMNRCPRLVRALAGGYRFKKNKDGVRARVPEKDNTFSHVADCLQYVCLVCHGGMIADIAQYLQPPVRPTGPQITSKGWT
jgi:hypothetical protein